MSATKYIVLSTNLLLVAYFILSHQSPNYDITLSDIAPDPVNGEYIYTAAGCASCHIKKGSENKFILAGGQAFVSPFGTFYAPNVSMSKQHGIGSWTQSQFVTAVRSGLSPKGQHYFPAFPYNAYAKMKDQDAVDLWSFWQTLPEVENDSKPHEIIWPLSIRRNVGIWKTLFQDQNWVADDGARGTYLVEALGHCAECHTPRNRMGALDTTRWMQGAKNPSGTGRIPAITQEQLKWSSEDITEYLTSGFTPDFDVAGGHMAAVVENTSQLSQKDRVLIAQYLINLKN